MPRPRVCRHILQSEPVLHFEPFPSRDSEPVIICRDELEAIRLADVLGYYHDQASDHMKVSRSTFSRILKRAHHAVGMALVEGRTLLVADDAPVETYAPSCICGCRRRRHLLKTPGGSACPVHPEKLEDIP